MTPGESKSLIRFPPAQVAPLQLQVIPPTKEHAASHQSRRLSIGLHPHPAPSSPSGSIISIWLHHFHHLHWAPSFPSGSIITIWLPSSLSGSIIPIRLHHLHHIHWAPSPPSGSITSIQLHHLHWAPSPLPHPSSPYGSIISIQLHHLHHLHWVPSPPSGSITSIQLHHLHWAPSPPPPSRSPSGSIIPIWLPASPSGSIISIGLHQTASSPLGSITSIRLHQAQQLQSLKGESVTWLQENNVTQSGQRTLYPLGELGSFQPQLNCVRLNHDCAPVFVQKFTMGKEGCVDAKPRQDQQWCFHTVSTQHFPKFPFLQASRLGLATQEVCE